MKSKTSHAFWLRWMGVSSLHSLIFTSLWVFNPSFFMQWQWSFIPLNLISGIALAFLQYWAMPATMRPDAKRWLFASIFGQALSVSLHAIVFYNFFNLWLLLTTLFLPQALMQSWALSERFKKAWLFALASLLPALIFFLQPLTFYSLSLWFVFEMLFWTIRAILLGTSISYLQRYQSKETSSLTASYERLAIQEEESFLTEETLSLTQQKLS